MTKDLKECYDYISTLAELDRPKDVESLLEELAFVFMNRQQLIRLARRLFLMAIRQSIHQT